MVNGKWKMGSLGLTGRIRIKIKIKMRARFASVVGPA
jgi:hypothetical protein